MSLEPRLNILRQSGMLCDENHEVVQSVIRYFDEREGIQLTEENSAAFITHLCQSLERIKRGEDIEALDEAIYEAAREEPTFGRACEITDALLAGILPPVPDTELKFIHMHVGVLLGMLEA